MYVRRAGPLTAKRNCRPSIPMNPNHGPPGIDPLLTWNKAVPLSAACVRFAPKDKARRYQELLEARSMPAMVKRADERMREGEDGWAALQSSNLPSHDLNSLRDETTPLFRLTSQNDRSQTLIEHFGFRGLFAAITPFFGE